MRFLQRKTPAQTVGDYSVRFDLSFRKAEFSMQSGGPPPPEALGFILRMQNVSLSRAGKSLVLAIVRRDSGIAAVAS